MLAFADKGKIKKGRDLGEELEGPVNHPHRDVKAELGSASPSPCGNHLHVSGVLFISPELGIEPGPQAC